MKMGICIDTRRCHSLQPIRSTEHIDLLRIRLRIPEKAIKQDYLT